MKDRDRHDELMDSSPKAPNGSDTAPLVLEQTDEDLAAATTDYQDPILGTKLAERYQIQALIGSGATSCVYRAEDLRLSRPVAVKLLHSHLASDSDTVRRFQQEVKTASVLKHASAVPIHDRGTTKSGQPFLVMELVEGQTLAALIQQSTGVDLARAVNLFLQVCACLSSAHERGIIHRDLKPGNLMINTDADGKDHVRVLDFGIAKVLPVQGETFQRLTQSGEMLGSLLYMSPEQCLDQDLDARCDVYSLGCVMYETLTGSPPLRGRTAFETMNKHLTDMPEKFSRVRPDLNLPDAIEQIVFKSMAKKPEQRYQTIAELVIALKAVSSTSTKNLVSFSGAIDQLLSAPQAATSISEQATSLIASSNQLSSQPQAVEQILQRMKTTSIDEQAKQAVQGVHDASHTAIWCTCMFGVAFALLLLAAIFLHWDWVSCLPGYFLVAVMGLVPFVVYFECKEKLPSIQRGAYVVQNCQPTQMLIRKVNQSGAEGTGKYRVLLASNINSDESTRSAEVMGIKAASQPFWNSMAAASLLDDLSARHISTDVYTDPDTGEPVALAIKGELVFLKTVGYAGQLQNVP